MTFERSTLRILPLSRMGSKYRPTHTRGLLPRAKMCPVWNLLLNSPPFQIRRTFPELIVAGSNLMSTSEHYHCRTPPRLWRFALLLSFCGSSATPFRAFRRSPTGSSGGFQRPYDVGGHPPTGCIPSPPCWAAESVDPCLSNTSAWRKSWGFCGSPAAVCALVGCHPAVPDMSQGVAGAMTPFPPSRVQLSQGRVRDVGAS
jgi:hypothetical protein